MKLTHMSFISSHRGGDALISGPYRYWLQRWWGPEQKTLLWVLLNPSWADEQKNDTTLTRLIGYSMREGYTRLEVVNLFAFRQHNPKALLEVEDPQGPDNDFHILDASQRADKIIVAWGNTPFRPRDCLWQRDSEVLHLLSPRLVWCFGTTRRGCPLHPLYLSKDRTLEAFRPRDVSNADQSLNLPFKG